VTTLEMKQALVDMLVHVAQQKDRATLAQLRGSLADGRRLDALSVVIPTLTGVARDELDRAEDDAILVAQLFALAPSNSQSGAITLPRALARITRETGSDSIEARFRALLSAARDDVDTHLRNAVTLVRTRITQPINWLNLYATLSGWDDVEGRARREWARDYWGKSHEATDVAA
jgi:CRISPR type I-E-associated protein CasB/Cse2